MNSALVVILVGVLVATGDGYRVKHEGYEEMDRRVLEEHEREVNELEGAKNARFKRKLESWRSAQYWAELKEPPTTPESESCEICRSVVDQLMQKHKDGATRQDLFDAAYEFCLVLPDQDPSVCSGVIDINIDFFIHIFNKRPSLGADTVCAVILQASSCILSDPKFLNWSVHVDPNGQPITESKHFPNSRGPNDIKIVQITDLHYDPKYEMGFNAVCKRPVCCRSDQGIPENPKDRAGRWGDYRDCDSPWDVVEDVIDQIAEFHPDATYIYHTGDMIGHGVWDTSIDYNVKAMDRIYRKLLDRFPNIPVLNIVGNHEAHPSNIFAPSTFTDPQFSTKWLYRFSADRWISWLPETTRYSIERGGYYTFLARPGFRIIALNNQDCYILNWWILWNPNYLTLQMQWLHDVLLTAERNNEKVHILAHIPYSSTDAMFRICQREYRRIIERFHNTISAQFNGHTHRDEFNVFYSRANPKHAINVAWNGGSTTSFTSVNPNYNVYYVDPETYQVTDFESYIFNLTDANRHPDHRPHWYKLYSFAEEFGMHNLSPAEADKMVRRLGTPRGRDELQRYWEFTVKMGDPMLRQGCDDNCLLMALCRVVVSEMNDDTKCDELRSTFFP